MLFIYWLEGNPHFSERVRQLLERAFKRNDQLFTSYLALGEILAGAAKSPHPQKDAVIQSTWKRLASRSCHLTAEQSHRLHNCAPFKG